MTVLVLDIVNKFSGNNLKIFVKKEEWKQHMINCNTTFRFWDFIRSHRKNNLDLNIEALGIRSSNLQLNYS